MRKETIYGLISLLLLCLLAMLAGCGGATQTLALENAQGDTPLAGSPAENLDGSSAGVTGLPAIPSGLEALRSGSATDGEAPSVGPFDYIDAGNAFETGHGLLLQPPGFGLAWALYGIGAGDCDLLGLDVNAYPMEGASGYFVAVANYSSGSWMVSGPHEGEAKVRLPRDPSFISPAGDVYFLVFAIHPKGAMMQGASLILDSDQQRPTRRPHAPWGLEASDGTVDNGIGLRWHAPRRGTVDYYVIMRRLQPDQNPGDDRLEQQRFVAIGRSNEEHFLDDNARPGVRYFYTVFAVNEAGRSGHSNVDGGWWGERDTEAGLFISGHAATEDGRPVPGIIVSLPGTDRSRVLTDDEGRFVFRNLDSGSYTVHAGSGNERLIVRPADVDVVLRDESVRGIDFTVLRAADLTD
ncbi:MAG: carboxypeptidase regulatory-like domain-containing protein [bacterium]